MPQRLYIPPYYLSTFKCLAWNRWSAGLSISNTFLSGNANPRGERDRSHVVNGFLFGSVANILELNVGDWILYWGNDHHTIIGSVGLHGACSRRIERTEVQEVTPCLFNRTRFSTKGFGCNDCSPKLSRTTTFLDRSIVVFTLLLFIISLYHNGQQ